MTIYVERPPRNMGESRSRTFNADHWDVSEYGSLELYSGDTVIAEIVAGDWLLAEDVPGDLRALRLTAQCTSQGPAREAAALPWPPGTAGRTRSAPCARR